LAFSVNRILLDVSPIWSHCFGSAPIFDDLGGNNVNLLMLGSVERGLLLDEARKYDGMRVSA